MKFSSSLTIALAAFSAVSCNGIFENIYDDLSSGNDSAEGFSVLASRPNRMILTIDASDFNIWTYVSLKNLTTEKFTIPLACDGEWDGCSGITYQEVKGNEFTMISSIHTDPQQEPSQWDLAIHRFDVRTNDGEVSGTNLTDIDDAAFLSTGNLVFTGDSWSNSRVMVDLSDMMAYRIGYQNISSNPILSDWVKMDISCPPPSFTASGRVYILRLSDGTLAALKMRSYISQSGEKGHLTIDILYPLQ